VDKVRTTLIINEQPTSIYGFTVSPRYTLGISGTYHFYSGITVSPQFASSASAQATSIYPFTSPSYSVQGSAHIYPHIHNLPPTQPRATFAETTWRAANDRPSTSVSPYSFLLQILHFSIISWTATKHSLLFGLLHLFIYYPQDHSRYHSPAMDNTDIDQQAALDLARKSNANPRRRSSATSSSSSTPSQTSRPETRAFKKAQTSAGTSPLIPKSMPSTPNQLITADGSSSPPGSPPISSTPAPVYIPLQPITTNSSSSSLSSPLTSSLWSPSLIVRLRSSRLASILGVRQVKEVYLS